ncbi:MAG: ABC transporter permease subunit [Bacillota bacterium]
MDILLSCTMNETQKILSKKKYIILFIISVFVTITASVINIITGQSLGAALFNNISLPITILNFMSSLILPLFILMLTSDSFSGEFLDSSIVMSLVRPISRYKIYISKIISIGVCTFAFLLGTFLVALIASLFGGRINDIIYMIPKSFISYLAAVIPMLLIAVLTAFMAQFTKSGSATIVLMILASVFLSTVSIFVPEIVTFLPTTYFGWYQNFYSGTDIIRTLNELLYILAYGIIFLSAGSYLFERKDF